MVVTSTDAMEEERCAVIIPCYNVAPHIEGVVARIPDVVDLVVLVDDKSTDNTLEIIRSLSDPRVTVLQHDRNRGVGAAMTTGYRHAIEKCVDFCVKLDGDGQMAPEDIPLLLDTLRANRSDYAKGNRFHDVEALRAMPKIRLLGNAILSFMTKLVSGYWSIFDPTNGYTVIRTDVLRRLELERLDPRYFFETNMLIELNILGAVVTDCRLPARYGNERSSLRISRVLLKFPGRLVRGLCRRFLWRYLIEDFNALTVCVLIGLPSLLFGIAFGTYHWWLSVTTGIPATTGQVMFAALPIVMGFQALLVAVILDMLYQPKIPLRRSTDPIER